MINPIVDYYAVLGVQPTAEDIVIRAAYKALAQRYHPDRFAGSKDEAHRRMSDLAQAYEVLADPLRRPKYDRRRVIFTRSLGAGFAGSARYGSPAPDPADLLSARSMRGSFRVALATLLSVVVVLSAFNLFQYSAPLKEWLGPAIAGASGLPNGKEVATAVETAFSQALPAPPGDPSAVLSVAGRPSVKERTRAVTVSAANQRPAKSAPAAAAPKAKPKTPPARTCSHQEQLLGLCN